MHVRFVHPFHLQHKYVLFSGTDPQVYSHSRILIKKFNLHISNTRSFTLLAKANGLNICSEAGKNSVLTDDYILSSIKNFGSIFQKRFHIKEAKMSGEGGGEHSSPSWTFLNEFSTSYSQMLCVT